MSFWSLIVRNLFYFWRVNSAVAAGVAAATAVLCGALIVGESMRQSLRDLALERLDRVDEILISENYFRAELVDELTAASEFSDTYDLAVPAITFPRATVERAADDGAIAAPDVFLMGIPQRFWELSEDPEVKPAVDLQGDQIAINRHLAESLGIDRDDIDSDVGVLLTVRVPKPQGIHGDSALGKKDDSVISLLRLRVVDILPNKGIARFGLHPSQTLTSNAFVPLELLQQAVKNAQQTTPRGRRNRRSRESLDPVQPIDKPVNTILVAGRDTANPPSEQASAELNRALQPTIEDLGLILREIELTYEETTGSEPQVAHRYFSLSSRKMMFDQETEQVATEAFAGVDGQLMLTYLANEIALLRDGRPVDQLPIPFSTMSAIDWGPTLMPTLEDGNPAPALSDSGIALNAWTARDLGAQVGDRVRVTYFDPEAPSGDLIELSTDLEVEAILAFTPRKLGGSSGDEPLPYDVPPTFINDPDLTPFVPGFSDAESMNNPEGLPFPTMDRMRPGDVDDDYWNRYRTTPKAFVSLATGKKLWASRFGAATAVRIPERSDVDLASLRAEFDQAREANDSNLSFVFQPIKRQWIKASSGTTPFDALFLSLSIFIVVSAVLLVALLFRLGVEQRASQIGLLMAMGFSRHRVSRMLVGEGLLISATGGLLGVLLGVCYGQVMLWGLSTWWVAAIVTPFLQLKIGWLSIVAGFLAGMIISSLTIMFTLWTARKSVLREMLNGRLVSGQRVVRGFGRWVEMAVGLLIVVSVGLAGAATQLAGEAQGGAFVGSGCLLLGALLTASWIRMRSRVVARLKKGVKQFSISGLSASNIGRNAGRSTLTIGLVAVASFLIIAISAFYLEPTEAGKGGFDYIVETNLPVYENLDSVKGREELLGEDAGVMDGCRVLSLRLKSGDNASCNNPYQASQPRILGLPRTAARYFDDEDRVSFDWAGSTAKTEQQKQNPWHLLFVGGAEEDQPIPVVIDKNTAMYSLKIYSIGTEFELVYDETVTVRFKVVGFLANSVLQGSLIISEEHLARRFPDVAGYRYHMISLPSSQDEEALAANWQRVNEVLRIKLGDLGIAATSTDDLLSGLLAVQNTYLSTFQSLGALGLLFGTFGLATVQIRNVLERRRELALMRAEGFSRQRLSMLVVIENAGLLMRGLGIGVGAALFAILPFLYFGDASIPWIPLSIMLTIIVLVGLATSGLAIRSVVKTPVLAALRRE